LHHAADADLESALAYEDRAQTECFGSDDHHEAIRAFVDKRPPRFAGR
jgi:enoyl-CoA hydratase/carnithine racemase